MDMAIIYDVSVRFEPLAQVDNVHHREQLVCPGSPPVIELGRASPIEVTTATSMAARYRTQSIGFTVTTLEHSECFLRKIRGDVLPIPLINFESESSPSSPSIPTEL